MIGPSLNQAKKSLIEGNVVAIPTETVYGLAGNAYHEPTVKKIFQIKKRPLTDPLIVHTASIEQVYDFVSEIPPAATALAQAFWPGPLTLLLPKKKKLSDFVTSGLPHVGVRLPSHPLTQQLLKELPFPLAAPSANPFGYISPTTAQHVEDQLGAKVDYILDGGPCSIGVESTIIGFKDNTPTVYRLGGITLERIQEVVGPISYRTHLLPNEQPQAPGTLPMHYAPVKPLIIENNALPLHSILGQKVALIRFKAPIKGHPLSSQYILSKSGDLEEATHHFFALLRMLDKLPYDAIIAERFPNMGLGKTLNERLERASHK